MKARRTLLGLVLALTGLSALAGTAQGEVTKEPGWKILAATGPSNLPPKQSEVQRVTVGAEGGTFTLARKAEGVGTPVATEGHLTYTSGNPVATIESVTGGASFEVGLRLQGTGIVAGTKVLSCSTDCKTPGSTVTLSNNPTASKTNQKITIFTRELSGVTGIFYVGDEITNGEYLEAGTTVTAVGAGTLTLSKPTTSAYLAITGAISLSVPLQSTAPLPYSASPAEVQAALEAIAPYAGAVAVEGGPGGDAEHPYSVAFGGPRSEQDVGQLTADPELLTGPNHYVNVFTTVPGGPGTGEIGIIPANVGGAATSGTVTLHLGPLPAGILVSGAPENQAGGSWSCAIEGGASEVTCTSSASVAALTPAWALKVPVEVQPSVASSGQATVTISGGGASAPASYAFPVEVSADPAEAGIASFFSEAFDADGKPSTQAGGHPYSQVTLFQLKMRRSARGTIIPAGDMRDLNVDLPPGFVGNPLVTPRCPQGFVIPEDLTEPATACFEPDYVVGKVFPGVKGFGSIVFDQAFGIFNDVPVGGTAAEFSSKLAHQAASLVAAVRSDEDFGLRISSPSSSTLSERVYGFYSAFYGEPESAGGKALFRNATDCAEQAREAPVVRMSASSWQHPGVFSGDEEALEPVTGCEELEFEPEFSFQPTSDQGSSGVGATAHLHIDQSGLTDPEELGTPDLKQSVVRLPEGFTVNPSQANGLEACSEAQVGYEGPGALPNPTRFNNNPVTCPDASKLGTVDVHSPLLEEDLQGTIYLGKQNENPFNSLIGLYLVIESPRFGITLKLPGKADLDPSTGQVTATFDYVPQQPVEDLTLHFRGGGGRSEFATPEVCGNYATQGTWTPWSAPESGPSAVTEDSFTVSGGCSASAAARPFNPGFEAGAVDPIAGAYSPLVIKLTRKDGEQELKNIDFTLPPGMSAKLAGVPYCADAAIAAASAKTGKEEQASSSCPSASQIGTVNVGAGVGSEPFYTSGKAYLAGPYKGAPLSAVVITPAVAGPFDLGNVVVRAPLNVNLETAQITANSDPIPTILDGIPLKVRSVAIKIDRSEFSINPTNCEAMAVTASLGSSDGATTTPSNRFQVGGCENLGFKPKLKVQLNGATKRAGHPALKAVVTMPKGGANISRIQVGLPHALFVDQGNLDKVCTQPELKSNTCPASSVYGHVKATSPLLEQPLEGNVYLGVGYGHKLPDLVTELNGQIRILAHGKIDTTKQHGLRTTFEVVPDAPVGRIVLEMKGGKKYSLIENSENLCLKAQKASARFEAQNGRVAQLHPKIATSCQKSAKRKRRH